MTPLTSGQVVGRRDPEKSPAALALLSIVTVGAASLRRLVAGGRAAFRRLFANTRLLLLVSAATVAVINVGFVIKFRIDDFHHYSSVRDAEHLASVERIAEVIDQHIEFRVNTLTALLRLAPRDNLDRPIADDLSLQIATLIGSNPQVLYVESNGRFSGAPGEAPYLSPDVLKWLGIRATSTGRLQFEATGSRGTVVLAIPDSRNAGGTLFVVLADDWLRSELDEHSAGQIEVGLLDSSGEEVATNGIPSLLIESDGKVALKAALRESGRVFLASSAVAVVAKKLHSADWMLYAVKNVRQQELRVLFRALEESVLSFVLVLAPLGIVFWLFASRIYRPLAELKEWAIACGEGDLKRRLAWPKSRTDLADLGRVMDEMAAKLDRETKARSQFFAQMSHEIRTPMNAIIGFARLLLQGRDVNETQREQLLMIRSSGESLLTIINDLLDFAKAEAGKLTLLPAPFRPTSLLKAVVAMMESFARGKGIDLRLKLGMDLDTVVVADEARLRQVLVNLIGNAVKFTERGFVEVTASLMAGKDQIAHLIVVVSDTGPGLDKAVADRLFSPYSQANIEISRKYGGTGLGLVLCRQLSDLMGGRLSVDSVVNVGTSFTFAIPVTYGSEADIPREVQDATSVTHSRRILLVEDQFINQRLALAILERAGHQVTLAASGVEAIAQARASDFDVILMDIQMPEMDGIEAAMKIRTMGGHNATVPIVAVTAQALSDEIEKCLAAGMTEYVAKPIDERQLLVFIQRLTKSDAEGDSCMPADTTRAAPVVAAACAYLNMAVVEQVEVAIGREDAVMLWEKLSALIDELLSEAPAASESGNLTRLAAVAHKLVGAAGALGASATSDLCREIEQDAKAGGKLDLTERVMRLSQIASDSLEFINRRFDANIKLRGARPQNFVRSAG